MSISLKAILQKERENKAINLLCEKFGFREPRFIMNELLNPSENTSPKLCLIVEDLEDKEKDSLLSSLQTLLIQTLGIKVKLFRKEIFTQYYSQSILGNSVSLLEDEATFRGYFDKMGGIDFENVIYEEILRDTKKQRMFERRLVTAQSFLANKEEKTKEAFGFLKSPSEMNKDNVDSEPNPIQQTDACKTGSLYYNRYNND